jgi:hypothetical protein
MIVLMMDLVRSSCLRLMLITLTTGLPNSRCLWGQVHRCIADKCPCLLKPRIQPPPDLSGSGAVHGFPDYISSSRGKLQGVTALTVMTTFLSSYSKNKYKLLAVSNYKGIISKCDGRSYTSLRSHRQANIDLFLTQKQAASNL